MTDDSFQKAIQLINKSNKVLVVPHTRPDGDACGSAAGMYALLKELGKEAEILLISDLPQWYRFLFEKEPLFFGDGFTLEKLQRYDLIVLVDVNAESQLPGFAELLKKKTRPVLVLDHHASADGLGDVEIVDTTAAAAGLIVYDLINAAGWPLDKKIAEPLFVAVSTDTGWFRFSNIDSRVHRCCAELLDKGVKPADIYHTLYQNFSLPRFKLMTAMLDTLQLHFDGKLATQHILQKDFDKTGAASSDTENLIDECQRISSVEVAALFVETKDNRIRCSLRSKGGVDVRKIAQKFGGGGHKQAAGTYLSKPMETSQKQILDSVAEQLEQIKKM
jgi:phosphoesterase RecJ-like protein